jgi:hypothetical protein
MPRTFLPYNHVDGVQHGLGHCAEACVGPIICEDNHMVMRDCLAKKLERQGFALRFMFFSSYMQSIFFVRDMGAECFLPGVVQNTNAPTQG